MRKNFRTASCWAGVPNHAFAQWGMDLVGRLSGANECFLMVLTEYQTKWAEVYPIPNEQATTVFKCLKKVIGRSVWSSRDNHIRPGV